MNLNKVFVFGNLTRDPEKKALPSGQSVVNLGIATNRFFKDQSGQRQQDTEFHNVVLFGRLADIAAQYLTKGSLVFIEGRLKTRNWQDQSGAKHYRTEIVAEGLQLGPRTGQSSGGGFAPRSGPTNDRNIKEEDIPVIEEEAVLEEISDNGEIDVKNIPF